VFSHTGRLGGCAENYRRTASLPCDILPILSDGVPNHDGPLVIGDDYVTPSGWRSEVTIFADRIEACASDEIFTIDAWDLS